MKREAVNHTKMKRLCRRLDVPLYQAIGLIESMFHLAGRETPRGDIGKLSNEAIALGVDYGGDHDALVQALIETDWLEPHALYRLVIADWHEHADEWVRIKLVRLRKKFWNDAPILRNQHLRIPGSRPSRRKLCIREAGGEPSRKLRLQIYARDGHMCLKCGSLADLSLDHIKPVSRGGLTKLENLQTLCRTCNGRKRDRIEDVQ